MMYNLKLKHPGHPNQIVHAGQHAGIAVRGQLRSGSATRSLIGGTMAGSGLNALLTGGTHRAIRGGRNALLGMIISGKPRTRMARAAYTAGFTGGLFLPTALRGIMNKELRLTYKHPGHPNQKVHGGLAGRLSSEVGYRVSKVGAVARGQLKPGSTSRAIAGGVVMGGSSVLGGRVGAKLGAQHLGVLGSLLGSQAGAKIGANVGHRLGTRIAGLGKIRGQKRLERANKIYRASAITTIFAPLAFGLARGAFRYGRRRYQASAFGQRMGNRSRPSPWKTSGPTVSGRARTVKWTPPKPSKPVPRSRSLVPYGKEFSTKSQSYDEMASAVRKAFNKQFEKSNQGPLGPTDLYCYVVDVYPDYLIVNEGEKYYQVDYGQTADGEIDFSPKSEWIEVKREWEEVAKELMTFIRLKQHTLLTGGNTSMKTFLVYKHRTPKPHEHGFARAGGAIKRAAGAVGRVARGSAKLQIAAATAPRRAVFGAVGKYGKAVGKFHGKVARSRAAAPARAYGRFAAGNVRRIARGVGGALKKHTLQGRLISGYAQGFSGKETTLTIKQADGTYRWVALASGAFGPDRDGEWVTEAALKEWVDKFTAKEGQIPMRVLPNGSTEPVVARWWHVGEPDPKTRSKGKGADLGVCDYAAMYGKTLITSGTFYDQKVGKEFADMNGALSNSLGFFHPPSQPVNKEFRSGLDVFEITFLPLKRASYPLAKMMVI